jgi:homoserine dehydrogenase
LEVVAFFHKLTVAVNLLKYGQTLFLERLQTLNLSLMSRKKCITAYVGEGRGEIKHLLLGEIQCVPQLFSALSETLHNQLKLVTNEKHEMTEEAHRLMKTIKQMEASLSDNKRDSGHEENFEVSYPLTRCIRELKEKHAHISKLHRERFEQVRSPCFPTFILSHSS